MDATIIDNYNRFVWPNDTLKIAGDFSMSRNFDTIKHYRDRIACKNVHLVLGNHDYLQATDYEQIFQRVTYRDVFKFEGKHVVMDHYAGRVWYNSHRGSFLLYGHSHGTIDDYGLSFDVGVDNWDFCPLSMQQVLDIMRTKEQRG